MMDEQLVNTVTIAGVLTERPSFSETATGELLADFWVRYGENAVWCICRGPVAESAKRFARAGVEIVVHGRLDWLQGESERPHVLVDSLAYCNPREVAAW